MKKILPILFIMLLWSTGAKAQVVVPFCASSPGGAIVCISLALWTGIAAVVKSAIGNCPYGSSGDSYDFAGYGTNPTTHQTMFASAEELPCSMCKAKSNYSFEISGSQGLCVPHSDNNWVLQGQCGSANHLSLGACAGAAYDCRNKTVFGIHLNASCCSATQGCIP